MELKGSGYGCHINNMFVGALGYADDVTLLSPSIRGLNAMITLREVFAKNFDITFNCKKSVCIKFGQKLIGYEHVYLNCSSDVKCCMFKSYCSTMYCSSMWFDSTVTAVKTLKITTTVSGGY